MAPNLLANASSSWHAMQGKYVYKLLAVDVPAAAGGEQRIFLEGDEAIYSRGSVIGELRDPFLNVRPAFALQMRAGS